jgi:predicted negative regulator of RcsB-dependent stress response
MAESPTPFAEINHGPSKMDQFLDAHQKKLIIAAILLAFGVIAYVIYSGIAEGEAQDAGAAMLSAEKAEEYQEVINKWPTSNAAASALPLLADIQGQNAPDDAIQTLKDFLANNATHPVAATAKVSLALRLLEKGDTDEATTLLTEVTESDTDTYIAPLACISLGDIAKAAGNKEKAKTWYEKAKGDSPDQSNTYSDAAVARLALVNAEPPQKIQPAPPAPAPVVPPVTPAPPVVTPPVTPPAPATENTESNTQPSE